MEFGAKQVIEVCLKVKEDERVLIISDNKTKEIADALKDAGDKVTNKIQISILEDYGQRPLKDFPQELRLKVLDSDVVIFAAKKVADEEFNETNTLRKKIKDLCIEKNVRYALMININEQMMEQGMSADYEKVKELSIKVYDKVKDAKLIKVSAPGGTDLIIELKHPRWKCTYGDLSKIPQEGFNLPSGEVYGYPENVNGVLVVDGIMGDYFSSKYGLTENFPIKIVMENSRIKEVNCNNKELEQDFKDYITKDDNANRIGEVGIGTNTAVKEFIGAMLQDEKHPGLHLACGIPCHDTNDDWISKVHCDMLIKNAEIIIDGIVLFDGKKFLV